MKITIDDKEISRIALGKFNKIKKKNKKESNQNCSKKKSEKK